MGKFFIEIHHSDKEGEGYYRNGLNEFNSLISLNDKLNATAGSCLLSDSYSFTNPSSLLSWDIAEHPIKGNLFFIENNSAHHLTHYLARIAFVGCAGPNLIINFDQHTDYGGDGIAPNNCGTWGYIPNIDYLRVGGISSNIKKELFYREDGPIFDHIESNKTDISSCLMSGRTPNKKYVIVKNDGRLKEIINQYSNIYVTVDMDILDQNKESIVVKESDTAAMTPSERGKFTSYIEHLLKTVRRTNWKNNGFKMELLLSWFNEYLPADKIIAADIIGFPPEYMLYRDQSDKCIVTKVTEFFNKYDRNDGETLLSSYINNINTVANQIYPLIKSV